MQFKVGLIGCGSIFPIHAKCLEILNNIEIVAVCDIKEERAKAAAEQCNCKYYVDYKEMIEKENIDVVHILTPHYLHAEMSIYALERGINVLTEKPTAIKYDDAVRMVQTAAKTKRILELYFKIDIIPAQN